MIGPDRKDRLKRALVVYKIPLTLTIISIAGLSMHYLESLPTLPDGAVPFLISVILLSLPSYIFAVWFLRWIDPDNPGVRVLEADAGREEKGTPHVVPRELWAEKTVKGPDPYPLDDGGYLVREFNWMEDVGELEVRGVWPANASPLELWYAKMRIDDMHDWYRRELQKASAGLARINRMGIEVYQGSLQEFLDPSKGGDVADELIAESIDSAQEDVQEFEEPPTMEETLDELQEDVEEAAEHAEETAELPVEETADG